MRIRLAHRVERTNAEGPGWRAAIWVQGCSIRCPGCFNPHTWSSTGGHSVEVDELTTWLSGLAAIEGLTLLGGEPFDQASACAAVAASAQRMGLSVMTFTGYRLEDLRAGRRDGVAELLASTDLLVDGPYDQSRPERRRPWLGSTNQRFHCLTPRYAELIDGLSTRDNRLEVRLRPDGSVFVNGMADQGVLVGLRQVVEQRAHR